jgi:hypothetical protein
MNTVFSPTQLDSYVKDLGLDNLPDGHKSAVIGAIDQNGVKVGLIYNQGIFEAEAAFEHDWNGNNEIGAKILASW